MYGAQIHSTAFTSPFLQGYNNYDISYTGLPINKPGTGLGDFDGDGFVTMADVFAAAQAVVSGGAGLTPAQIDTLDIDRDGILTMADIVRIMRLAAGL
jgi:hypothetical protein